MRVTDKNVWFGGAMRLVGALALVGLLTAALLLVHANGTACGMVYLVLVMWLATSADTRLAIFVALVCGVLFDYYFLEPFGTFTIAGFQGWLAMGAYLVSSFVAGRVADRARRQTEQALQRRADLERLYGLSQEMMLHEDAGGLVRDIPMLVERIFGLDGVLLYVRDQDQVYASRPDDSEQMRQSLRGLFTTPEGAMEIGEGYWAMSLVFGMKSVGTLAWRPAVLSHEVASAVTAQVAIALTRSLALEGSARLEAARSGDRLRTALIDSLTHELRTPLTSIRAAATTLQDAGEMDAETRDELAAIMVEESARLDKLIGEAIEMAQIDAEGVAIHRVAMQTRVLLDQAAEESRGQLSGHRVVIQVEGADSPARFDPNLMRRVLRHVLENAARYTPAGSRIVLRSRRVGDRVELLVEDNGPGIDVYDLPLIFEKFYRGKAGGRGGKGSGMGLAITRAILAAHGGAIGVESTPGKGTTFRIEFPAGDPLGDVGGAAGGASGMLEA